MDCTWSASKRQLAQNEDYSGQEGQIETIHVQRVNNKCCFIKRVLLYIVLFRAYIVASHITCQ